MGAVNFRYNRLSCESPDRTTKGYEDRRWVKSGEKEIKIFFSEIE